eukprot:TRINITY_DN11961_c0_g1_i2.p1 TRINITY_DN11961_c0_g1~~TRINITY_DN11961_c0_g1_i2.p1  ORF type:complete len:288 (-),score=56.16 TRINITY_DN11961_c0_g1_i2:47-790(-)
MSGKEAAGPSGKSVKGTLDWLFAPQEEGQFEAYRPVGVPRFKDEGLVQADQGLVLAQDQGRVGKHHHEPWNWLEGAPVGQNADLLLDEDLLMDIEFKAVPLVRRQLRIKHSEFLFAKLCNKELMSKARFSVRCLPTKRPQEVVAFRGNVPTVGTVVPKRWQLSVYYEPQHRSQVEAAFEQLGFSIAACEEIGVDKDPTEIVLEHQHGCGRYCFMLQLGHQEIEVADGAAVDKDLLLWKHSYEDGAFC